MTGGRAPGCVFFDDPSGFVDLGPTPYADARHHLDDEIELAGLRLARARAALDGAPTGPLDLQVAARRQWIDDRMMGTSTALPLTRVGSLLDLSLGDLDVLLLFVAVELDARRLAGFASGGAPVVALTPAILHAALAPADPSAASWLRELFGPSSLIARGILIRLDDPAPQVPASAAPLRISRAVLGAVLDTAMSEPAVAGILSLARTDRPWLGRDDLGHLARRIARPAARGISLWISGGSDGVPLAHAVATAAQRTLLAIELRGFAREAPWGRVRLLLALRIDQQVHGWVGLVEVHDPAGAPHDWAAELRALDAASAGPLIVVAEGDVPGLTEVAGTALRHEVPRPGAAERRAIWERTLQAVGSPLTAAQISDLAEAFPLTSREIQDVVTTALSTHHGDGRSPGLDAYRGACLARQHARLGRLADFVPHGFGWSDLVIPEEELERLREIVERQRYRYRVFTEWNMSSKLPYGSGTAALFSGPPGTGKTMAASVISAELGRPLYRVDLSRIVDKYIGETEKNLGRIFDAAAAADALLLFDEADSLFGKRTTVQSSHDRYANLETNYLLQRIEQHPGVSILTTNHVQNIDEAFARRIPFRVDFPFPDSEARAKIWRKCFADAVPREDLDFRELGEAFELSGGHIKSAAVRAVFMAAAEGGRVVRDHVRRAAVRELESMGRLAMPAAR